MEKYYKIAGLHFKMDTFGWLEASARPYESDAAAAADIVLDENWQAHQNENPDLSSSICYYNVTGSSFYQQLLDFSGMMLHSSAVAYNGKAYLFSANSGTGKSTHTSLWRRVFGEEHVRIVNDDKPAIRYEDGGWFVYGTPWSGKTMLNANLRYPLGGICFIERGTENEICPYGDKDLAARFIGQTSVPADAGRVLKLMTLVDQVIREVPVWKLRCNMDPEAAIVSYEAMSGEKWRK